MTSPSLVRRMGRLEAERPVIAPVLSPADREKAAERYAASLEEPEEMSEWERAYLASVTLHQIAADYDQILRGSLLPQAGR